MFIKIKLLGLPYNFFSTFSHFRIEKVLLYIFKYKYLKIPPKKIGLKKQDNVEIEAILEQQDIEDAQKGNVEVLDIVSGYA